MQCRDARPAIVECGLGWLGPESERALRDHLAICPACAAEQAAELQLLRGMRELHGEVPFEVDVGRRVAERIASLARIERSEVSPREIRWAAAFAAMLLAALGAGALPLWDDLWSSLPAVADAVFTLIRVSAEVARPLLVLLAIPLKLIAGAIETLRAFGSRIAGLEPAGIATLAFCYLAMATAITLILRRDFGRPIPARAREDL
jgi:hypothetical protein